MKRLKISRHVGSAVLDVGLVDGGVLDCGGQAVYQCRGVKGGGFKPVSGNLAFDFLIGQNGTYKPVVDQGLVSASLLHRVGDAGHQHQHIDIQAISEALLFSGGSRLAFECEQLLCQQIGIQQLYYLYSYQYAINHELIK